MKNLSNKDLSELCSFLISIEMLCKKYSHLSHIDAIKRITQISESNYQKADNILIERSVVAEKDLHYSGNR